MPHPVVRNRRLYSAQAAAAAPISPTDIADLSHWWKADSFSLSDGDTIGAVGKEWVDPIGGSVYYGRTIGGGGTLDPLYKTNIAGALPGTLWQVGLGFSPQKLLDNSNGSPANKIVLPSDWTILAVVKQQTVAPGTLAGGIVMGDAYAAGGIFVSDNLLAADDGTTARQADSFGPFTGINNATFRQVSGSIEFWRNNSQLATTGSMTLGTMKVSHTGAAAAFAGNASPQNTRWGGYIFEILIYTRALTTGEMTSLHTYFGRWGIV